MKRSIYKYSPRKFFPETTLIPMPSGARVLSVGQQYGELVFWVLVDPDAPTVKRAICVRPTGYELQENEPLGVFMGTVVMSNGDFVYHLFDLGESYVEENTERRD